MNWASFSDFLTMNGHGFYVWCAYGALFVGVVAELISLKRRRGAILTRLRREARNRNLDKGN